jgi:hypothetical protein
LAELEAHLRDSIAAWQNQGLSGAESFLIAAGRLGSAPALAPEFAKVNGRSVWLDRLLWIVVGIQLLSVLSGLSAVLADAAVIGGLSGFGYHFGSAPDQRLLAASIVPGLLLAAVQLLVLALAVWGCGWLVQRKGKTLSVFASQILRRPLFFGLVVIVSRVLLQGSMRGFNMFLAKWFPLGEFSAAVTSMAMAGIFISLAWTVTLAGLTVFLARRRFRLQANLA